MPASATHSHAQTADRPAVRPGGRYRCSTGRVSGEQMVYLLANIAQQGLDLAVALVAACTTIPSAGDHIGSNAGAGGQQLAEEGAVSCPAGVDLSTQQGLGGLGTGRCRPIQPEHSRLCQRHRRRLAGRSAHRRPARGPARWDPPQTAC